MVENYFGLIPTFLFAATMAGLFILGATFLGPKNPSPEKDKPFECGMEPFALPGGNHSVKFYLAGMLFVLFDVEIIFLFPWAVMARDLGATGFFAMMFFLALFLLGDAYAWRKGAFEWK